MSYFLSFLVLKVSTLIGGLIGLNQTWIPYCLKENKHCLMIKRMFIILVIILRTWNLSGCVDNIVLSRMSVRSLPVAGKFDRENVRKSTSEAGIKRPEGNKTKSSRKTTE